MAPGPLARISAALGAALFGYATAVQYNDPDWYTWMALYGGCTVACASAAAGRPRRWLALLLAAVAVPWCAWVARGVDWSRSPVESEVGRETLGLALVAVFMLALALGARQRERAS